MVNWQDYFDRDAGVMDWEGFYADGGKIEDIPQNIRDSFGVDGGAYNNDINVQSGGGGGTGGSGGGGDYKSFVDWLEGRIEPWVEETAPIRETFRRWLDLGGVEAGKEGAIARSAEGAAQRAGEGAAGMGMQNSGMNQAMQGSIWGQAMPAVLQNRTQNMTQAGGILSGLSEQLASLLRGQMGPGASAFHSIYGRAPFSGIWQSGGNQTAPFQGFGWPLTENVGGPDGGGGKDGPKPRGDTGDRQTSGVPQGCYKVFDRDGNWVSTDCSGQQF